VQSEKKIMIDEGCQEYIQNCAYSKSAALGPRTYMLLEDMYSLIMCYEAMMAKLVLNLICWSALWIQIGQYISSTFFFFLRTSTLVVPMTEEPAKISLDS
jgi:hypothetical protein